MKKVLLLIDCDFCRKLYTYSRFASEDTMAWAVHGNNIVAMAANDGWGESECRNFHYCPDCIKDHDKHAPS